MIQKIHQVYFERSFSRITITIVGIILTMCVCAIFFLQYGIQYKHLLIEKDELVTEKLKFQDELEKKFVTDEEIQKILIDFVFEMTGYDLEFREDISLSQIQKEWKVSPKTKFGDTIKYEKKIQKFPFIAFQNSKNFPLNTSKIIFFSNSKIPKEKQKYVSLQVNQFFSDRKEEITPKNMKNYHKFWHEDYPINNDTFHYSIQSALRIGQIYKLIFFFKKNVSQPKSEIEKIHNKIENSFTIKKNQSKYTIQLFEVSEKEIQNKIENTRLFMILYFVWIFVGLITLIKVLKTTKTVKRKFSWSYTISCHINVYCTLFIIIFIIVNTTLNYSLKNNKNKVETLQASIKNYDKNVKNVQKEIMNKEKKRNKQFSLSFFEAQIMLQQFFNEQIGYLLTIRGLPQKDLKKEYIENVKTLNIKNPPMKNMELEKYHPIPTILLDGIVYNNRKNYIELIFNFEESNGNYIRIHHDFFSKNTISPQVKKHIFSDKFQEYFNKLTPLELPFLKDQDGKILVNQALKILETLFQMDKIYLIENFSFFVKQEQSKEFSTRLETLQIEDYRKNIRNTEKNLVKLKDEEKQIFQIKQFLTPFLYLAILLLLVKGIFITIIEKLINLIKSRMRFFSSRKKTSKKENENSDENENSKPEPEGDGTASEDKAKEIIEYITNNFTLILPQDKKIITEKLLEINKAGYSATKFLSEVKKLKKVFDKAVGEKKKKDRIEKMKRDLKEKRKNF